jgi:hypothetical protein
MESPIYVNTRGSIWGLYQPPFKLSQSFGNMGQRSKHFHTEIPEALLGHKDIFKENIIYLFRDWKSEEPF